MGGHRGRDRSGRAYGGLGRARRGQVVRAWQAVGRDGRLQRDHGPAVVERGAHLGRDVQQVGRRAHER